MNILYFEYEKKLLDMVNNSLKLFKDHPNLENQYYRIFEIKSRLIGQLLDKRNGYNLQSKLDGLKFSHGLKENNYRNPLIAIFRELIKEGSFQLNCVDKFYDKLDNYIRSIKKKKLIKYTLIFPININFKNGFLNKFLSFKRKPYFALKTFRDLNVKYFHKIHDYVKVNFSKSYLTNAEKEEKDLILRCIDGKYTHFIGDIYARNFSYAVKEMDRDIEINAGIYIYTLLGYTIITRWGGDPFEKSISELNMPLVFVFNNNVLESILYESYQIPKKEYEVSLESIKVIENIIDDLSKIKNRKLKKLIFDAFGKYYIAIKQSNYSTCFIQFWNIIELLLLISPEVKGKEFRKRLKSIFQEDWELKKDYNEMIESIYQKRNLLVHESKDQITETDRNFVKRLVDLLLEVSINNCLEIRNKQMLEFYYQNLRKPLRFLKQEKQVLEKIIGVKSTKQS